MKKVQPTGIKWHFNVKRPDYLLNQSLVAASDLRFLKKKTGFGYTSYLAVFESGLVSAFSPAQEVQEQIKFYAKRIIKNPRIFDLFSKDYTAAVQALKVLLGQKMSNDYRRCEKRE